MNREQFLSIDLSVKEDSLYYRGTIYDNYNLFIELENTKCDLFQITYTDMQREPMGKFSGAIGLEKGRNKVKLIIKDKNNTEIYNETHSFTL